MIIVSFTWDWFSSINIDTMLIISKSEFQVLWNGMLRTYYPLWNNLIADKSGKSVSLKGLQYNLLYLITDIY